MQGMGASRTMREYLVRMLMDDDRKIHQEAEAFSSREIRG